jgi:hypothetical protein
MPNTDEKAQASLRIAIKAIKEVEGGSPGAINAATARNVLHQDLGYFGEEPDTYSLSEDTRDRLLAHARQDASHAVMNAHNAMQSAAAAVRGTRLLTILLIICTAAIIWAIWATS